MEQSMRTVKQFNDVTHTKHADINKRTTSCHLPCLKQSLSPFLNFNSQIKHINSINKLVAITTRTNPIKQTSIKRRFKAPNKKTIHMDQQPTNKLTSVATQTDTTSNKGRGLDP